MVAVPADGAGWYNSSPPNLQGLTDPNTSRTWIGRFVTTPTAGPTTLSISGSISFATYPGGSAQQDSSSATFTYVEASCPADVDGNGTINATRPQGRTKGLEPSNGGTTIHCLNHLATLAVIILLLDWGSDAARSDLNGDGLVNGADVGLMLLAWGPCL